MKSTDCLALAATLFFSSLLRAEIRPVWTLGKFDQSPVEFSAEAPKPGLFRIGQSDPARDWPRAQGLGEPSKIVFQLDRVEGAFFLKIAALIERPRVPALEITINGRSGLFYLHPRLSYSRGDFSYAFDPHESQSTIRVHIPNGFLQRGTNTITVACVDDPPSPADQRVSTISFDALSLEQDASARNHRAEITSEVEPTIFFRRRDAALYELVDVFIRSSYPLKGARAELDLQGKRYSATLSSTREFGEERISFEVPEWTGTVSATLIVRAKSRRAFELSLTPQRKWTVFVVPHTHLDIGYTDYQGKVAETQARVLGQAADLIRLHPDFRFSMDGSWNLQQVIETRSQQEQKRILDLIRAAKMTMPAQYANLLTGYASLETLYRSLYQSKTYASQFGLPFEYANITDVPTYSGSYPSILASSGVKYWVAASNNDRAPVFHYDHWNEKSPYWWEGPDGKRVLFWYSRHYEQIETLFGLPPVQDAIRESLPIFLQAYSKPAYKPDVVLLYGAQVENTDLYPAIATFASDWDNAYVFPKLKYATFPEFFHYIDQHYASELPVYKGDGGGYWEDGIGSDAYFAAEDRQNQARARSAEILSSLTHSMDATLNPPAGEFDDIWRNIVLFAEHTWLSWNSVSQPDHEQSIRQLRAKDNRAERASIEINDVMNRSLSQLADQIHVGASTLVAFNPLSRPRDALIETDLFGNAVLTDLGTHQNVPLQILSSKEGFVHVRFLARDLPAVGYKCFAIHYTYQPQKEPAATTNQLAIESPFYRVQLDERSGAVASIFDKQLQREIVDSSSEYKFGQYLYVTGGDGDTQMINPFPALPPGELTVHPASHGKLVAVERLPWGTSIRLTSSDVNTPRIETEILVFDNQKKIEFRYKLHKDYTNAKEAVYFAFPVALSTPTFAYASQQGWIDPARDLLKGGSVEWFNVQQWMAAHDENMALGLIPLDAALACFGDINRGKWPGAFQPRTSTIFSYAMNNYWHTNYRAGQAGDFTFRYVVTSSRALDSAALTQLGNEEMQPVEVNYVTTQDKAGNPDRPLPPEGESFLQPTDGNVALVTWKKAENGNGTILRLAETSGRATSTVLRFQHLQIASARLCSGVEDDGPELSVADNGVPLSFHPFEVLTVRIRVNQSE